MGPRQVEVMPPNTNRRPAVAGGWVRLGGRRPVEANCRDEVAASLAGLWDRTGQHAFTVREVYAEMLAAGTRYAESTVFKTMQRMKAPAGRAPWIVLISSTDCSVSGGRRSQDHPQGQLAQSRGLRSGRLGDGSPVGHMLLVVLLGGLLVIGHLGIDVTVGRTR